MPDRCDALFSAFPTARAKRIGSNIDIVATVLVLVGEPCHIPSFQNLLQPHDSLHRTSGILPAKQDRDCLFRGKATPEKTGSNLTHRDTIARAVVQVISSREARLAPGFLVMRTCLSGHVLVKVFIKLFLGSSSLCAVQFEDGSYPNRIGLHALVL